MEDTQPNEVRPSRKGSANIPRVRITRPAHAPYRQQWQQSPTRPPRKSSTHELVEVHLHLPQECHSSHKARKRWVEDQKSLLRMDRHLSVLSLEYLDHDNRVLFTCRTQQSAQYTGRHTRDNPGTRSHFVSPHIPPSIPQQAEGSHGDPTQSGMSRLSRIRSTSRSFPQLGDSPRRLDRQSSDASPGNLVGSEAVKPTTKIRSQSVQTRRADPVLPRRAAVHTVPQAENVIDLTVRRLGPVAEEHPARWPTFQSGYMDIALQGFDCGPRISPPEANVDPQPSISQQPAQVVRQCEGSLDVRSGSTMAHTVQSNICTNNTGFIPPAEGHVLLSHQLDVLKTALPPYLCRYSTMVQDGLGMSSLPATAPGFTSACDNLLLSAGSHDKPRRMLHNHGFTCVVTAHGVIDWVDATNALKLNNRIRSPSLPFEEFVDDACILTCLEEPVIILGHARKSDQITILNPRRSQVSRHTALHRDWNSAKKPGVSAVSSMMCPLKFVSGGYDHRIHLWEIAQDFSGASSVELAIKHNSLVHCLLPIVDSSRKLVSVGADRDVPIYDLSAECVVHTLKTSCIPYHAHKADARSCTLLEVSHLETQFEMRDHRLPHRAVQRFGFPTEERRGRFEKADLWSHFVICGDRNGAVHLWDLRNVSTEVIRRQCFSDPIIQVVHTGTRVLACSKRNELACINFQGDQELNKSGHVVGAEEWLM